jgi:CAAX prenyl protease-like protein
LSWWSIVVGVVGVVVWIGLCKLKLESKLFEALGIEWLKGAAQRSAFNPLEELADRPLLAYGFLAVRFFGLVVVVALIEEFFLRGFLIRFFVRPDWTNAAIGDLNRSALLVATIVPVLLHPGEMLAAAVWFSLVTLLMVKTRNIWDCVVAHAVTNLLLGMYVLATGEWQFL